MKSLIDSPPPNTPSICIEGFPGCGKTTLALQFPSPYIADCDLNLTGPLAYLKSVNKLALNVRGDYIPYYEDHTIEKPNIVPPEKRFERLLLCIAGAIKDPSVKTIIVDSLSTVDNFIYERVKKDCEIADGKPLAIQHWRPFRDHLMKLITLLRYCGKTTITLCHVESIIKDTGKPGGELIGYKPVISTKIGEFFAGFFTDMWMMQALPGAQGKVDYKLYATRTGLYQDLKNAYQLPSEIKNPTYDEINKYLKL